MKKLHFTLLLLCALLWSGLAGSQTVPYPPNPAYANNTLSPIYPYRGTYYDPKQSGTGLQVDLGADGSSFVTLYSYTPTGAPTWYIVGGTYVPSDEITRWTTGVVGTLTGPFYNATGGQCLGCPYTPTGGAVISPFTPTLTWVNSREVKMVVGDQSWDFIAPNFDSETDGDYLIGNWVIHFVQTYFASPTATQGYLVDNFATIRIARSSEPVSVAPGVTPGLTPFKSSDTVYSWTCNETIPAANGLDQCTNAMLYPSLDTFSSTTQIQPGQFEFWYDPDTNRLGADVVRNGEITSVNTHIDLYIENPNFIIGRGITEGTGAAGVNFYSGLARDGAMNLEVILQRIPDASQGQNWPNGVNGLSIE